MKISSQTQPGNGSRVTRKGGRGGQSSNGGNRWLETSLAEKDIASEIAARITTHFVRDEIPRVIESLGIHFAGEEPPISVRDLAQNLGTRLDCANFDQVFPRNQTDVSSNVIARLAFELRNTVNVSTDEGAVATPYFLAEGIVRAAFFFRLQAECSPELHERVRRLLGGTVEFKDLTTSHRVHLRKVMLSLRWCDPCVGGGVFLLALLSLASDLGLDPGDPAQLRVEAWDICPLSIAAARIRTALLLRSLTGRSVVQTLRTMPVQFHVGSSLGVLAESGELSVGSQSFDIIVGNPPYVRSDVIPRTIKHQLCELFPSLASKNYDLYFYFLAGALFSLRREGVVGFVSSASFHRSRHGEALRAIIAKHSRVRAVVDFGELCVFRDADVPYTSVYFLQKLPSSITADAKGILLNKMPAQPVLELISKGFKVSGGNFSRAGWHISTSPDQWIVQCLSAAGVPLKAIVGKTYSGIKTGYARAYTVPSNKKTELEILGVSPDRFRPLLLPTDIRQWAAEWSGHYLILVEKGETLNEHDPVYRHLLKFRNELAARTDVTDHLTWYGLRACSYYPLFEEPKIVFPDISKQPRFAFDARGFYVPDGAFFLCTAEPSFVGVLNSAVATYYFQRTCNSIGHFSQGGRLRFKKTYVENFPIPSALVFEEGLRTRAAAFQSQLSSPTLAESERAEFAAELDRLLLDAYNLPARVAKNLAKACKI